LRRLDLSQPRRNLKRDDAIVKLGTQTLVSSSIALVLFGALLFAPAGTFDYWQAWVLIAVFVVVSAVPTVYLAVKNPAALQRRMRGGPTAETRSAQKIASSCTLLAFPAAMVVSAVDHRFAWSQVPMVVSLIGDAVVAVGIATTFAVIVQNGYAAANITVETGQKVVSTGLYGLVRHPMYVGILVILVGTPLALGSYWGLLVLIPATFAFAFRILDEEKMLKDELDGYLGYTRDVHYRLMPFVW
jgi:protein-S-isoprenylcysteine O-methyltransferase Ste14